MPPSTDETNDPLTPEQEWQEKRKNRKYQSPVAWLLGRQLLSSLKGTLLFTAYGSKLDARDWMRAEEYPAATEAEAKEGWQKLADPSDEDPDFWKKRGEFWFDYISDTGDGMKATYSIAYLCMSDLWAKGSLADLQNLPFGSSRSDRIVGFVAGPDAPTQTQDDPTQTSGKDKYPNADLNLSESAVSKEGNTTLPRGQFLLVGGDATYHMSDYESLHTRFQTPFTWAHMDVERDGRLMKTLRRPLFGIPGNHDYYDQLDGFRRQFHDPVRPDKDAEKGAEGKLGSPQLMIPGFFRRQYASYVSLRLPFGWHLWGLDTEVGKIDERQRNFFRSVKVRGDLMSVEDGAKPDKLIVATSAPTTVFGKHADKDDEKSAKAFYQLGLPRPFLDPDDVSDEDGQNPLEAHQCRLDLSGDIHQYARYWGRASGFDPRGHKLRAGGADHEHPEPKDNYASVVSGLGGAFHHPTTTYAGEVCEQVLYPPQGESRRAVAYRIFNPLRILRGGGIGVIGFLLAFLLYFAATFATSSSQNIDNVGWLKDLGIVDGNIRIRPTAAQGPEPAGGWRFFYGREEADSNPPPGYKIGFWLSIVSFFSLLASFIPFWFILRKYRLHEEVSWEKAQPKDEDEKRKKTGAPKIGPLRSWAAWLAGLPAIAANNFGKTHNKSMLWYKKLMWQFNLYAWPLLLLSAASLVVGLLALRPYRASITPFGNSLLVLLALVWAGSAIFLSVRYSDWLTSMASKVTLRFHDWWLIWLITLVAAFAVFISFAVFGRYNTASDMVTDILLTIVVAAVVIGLTLLGGFKFGEVKRGVKRIPYGALGGVIGFCHAVLQLFVAFLLVRRGSAMAWAGAWALLLIMQLAGWLVMRSGWHKLLALVGPLFGAAMLVMPYAALKVETGRPWGEIAGLLGKQEGVSYGLVRYVLDSDIVRYVTNLFGVVQSDTLNNIGVCVVAGFVGVLSSCVWLGWYFATALAFDGHNNEAGGAARIERFKQFIRFRLTDEGLTGFVVAIDDPEEDGNKLRPRLVDVIHLTRKT